MTPIHTIVYIPKEIQSGNVLAYGHWRNRMSDRDNWLILLLLCMPSSTAKATGKRHVTVTAYRKRRVDEDNLSSGFKHGRDALVRLGYLLDDNKKYCKFTYNDCLILSDLPQDLIKLYGRKPLTVIELLDVYDDDSQKNKTNQTSINHQPTKEK